MGHKKATNRSAKYCSRWVSRPLSRVLRKKNSTWNCRMRLLTLYSDPAHTYTRECLFVCGLKLRNALLVQCRWGLRVRTRWGWRRSRRVRPWGWWCSCCGCASSARWSRTSSGRARSPPGGRSTPCTRSRPGSSTACTPGDLRRVWDQVVKCRGTRDLNVMLITIVLITFRWIWLRTCAGRSAHWSLRSRLA